MLIFYSNSQTVHPCIFLRQIRNSQLLKLMYENFFPGTLLDDRELKPIRKLPLHASFHFLLLGGSEPKWKFTFMPSKLPPSLSLAVSPSHSCACANTWVFLSTFISAGEITTQLEGQEKEKLRLSDTKPLDLGASEIFQAQQDHKMPLCLRGTRAWMGKEES